MQRLHVSLTVADLARSVRFYSTLFAAEPTLVRDDYAKWMLEDPRLNFSLSTHGADRGIDHVGLQVDSEPELADLRQRLERAQSEIFEQPDVTCCYARSKKAWIRDPDGVAWETFVTHGQTTNYGDGGVERALPTSAAQGEAFSAGD